MMGGGSLGRFTGLRSIFKREGVYGDQPPTVVTPSGLSPEPAWVLEGGLADLRVGTSVASAGDLDDDGYDDVVIGVDTHKHTHRIPSRKHNHFTRIIPKWPYLV